MKQQRTPKLDASVKRLLAACEAYLKSMSVQSTTKKKKSKKKGK